MGSTTETCAVVQTLAAGRVLIRCNGARVAGGYQRQVRPLVGFIEVEAVAGQKSGAARANGA